MKSFNNGIFGDSKYTDFIFDSNRTIVAVDPGQASSGVVILKRNRESGKIELSSFSNGEPNSRIFNMMLKTNGPFDFVMEFPRSAFRKGEKGGYIGGSVLETCMWAGAFAGKCYNGAYFIYPDEIRTELCGNAKASKTDKARAVREWWANYYRVPVNQVKGRKLSPGPLYGVSGTGGNHVYDALAVAVVFMKLKKQFERRGE